ncbi:exopolysaccharide biosynthesis polyprenyl glycosylphosphotransferase [Mumia sp. zg.B17]|uniref:exopolysaccharide biosynthesis polyprenyl glycosylphosphotransferase n=1 Tax=Mumia sp. zg.B17 TaxID=2855446 RepID=UPI001C6E5395|nr:exopolysaccharide biosynthesis polyprenyl glycosylphosphotransferase [Mumia sp. zg.B17]MBW9208007.1 exopolysaccharide biosynthesis polyprenyl glycosylphosphotransferase [Mumia sp. zg.B17]
MSDTDLSGTAPLRLAVPGQTADILPGGPTRRSLGRHRDRVSDIAWFGLPVLAATAAAAAAVSAGPIVSSLCLVLVLLPLYAVVAKPGIVRTNDARRYARRTVTAAAVTLTPLAAVELLAPGDVRAALAVVLTACSTALVAGLLERRRRPAFAVLVVGDGDGIRDVVNPWATNQRMDVVGACVPTAPGEPLPDDVSGVPVLGRPADVETVARSCAVDWVVIAPGAALSVYDVRRLTWQLERARVPVSVATDLNGVMPHRVEPVVVGRRMLLDVSSPKPSSLGLWGKDLLDRVGGLALLLLASPLLLVLMALVKLDSRGPAFFRQVRAGRNGHPFTMIKLRTMVVDAEERLDEVRELNEGAGLLFKIGDDPRITRLGRALRKLSLDELPQLINVVRGDMSLVGPRPGLLSERDQYDDWIARRLRVKPGMTGLWQVSGRSSLDWEQAVRLDIDYVDNWTMRRDLGIAARTLRAVVCRDGAG